MKMMVWEGKIIKMVVLERVFIIQNEKFMKLIDKNRKISGNLRFSLDQLLIRPIERILLGMMLVEVDFMLMMKAPQPGRRNRIWLPL